MYEHNINTDMYSSFVPMYCLLHRCKMGVRVGILMILNACNNELFDPGRDQQRSTRYSFNVLHGIRSTFYTVFVQRSTRYSFIQCKAWV